MADKNIKLKTKSGDVLLPITLSSNVSYGSIDSGVSVADKISNAWSKDNLKGSTNITLERQFNPNVLDPETTIACFHFDGDATNVMNNGMDLSDTFKSCIVGYTDGVTYPWYNGKKALIFRPTSNYRTEFNMFASSITGIGTTGDFTLEFRVMRPAYSAPDVQFCAGPNYTDVCFTIASNECVFKTRPSNWGVKMDTNQWYHVVMVRKNGYISLYTPERRWEHTNSISSNFTNVGMVTYGYNTNVIHIAELCVWNFAKYDGETLVSPTAPYEMSSTGSVYNITATGLATTSALAAKQDTLVSGTNIKTLNNTSLLGSGDITVDSLPAQTGQSGKFLTTDGTDAAWAQTWNETNLVSGKNVKIEKHINPHVITEDTLALWHFDSNFMDVISNIELKHPYNDATIDSNNYKFTSGGSLKQLTRSSVGWDQADSGGQTSISSFELTTNSDLTFDFWLKLNDRYSDSFKSQDVPHFVGFNSANSNPFGLQWTWDPVTAKLVFKDIRSNTSAQDITISDKYAWHHVAYTYKGTTKVSVIYFDGVPLITNELDISSNFNLNYFNLYRRAVNYQAIPNVDEFRLSKVVLYNGDFSSDLPTEPYQASGSTPDYWELNTTGLAKETDLAAKQDTLVSGTNIKTINNTSLLGSGNIDISGGASLPDQTGHSGQFLTTDGTDASWATIIHPVPTLSWYTSDDWTLSQDGLTLTIADTSSANLVKVYRNGVLLQPTADYTISGTSLVVHTALTATEKITLEVY